MQNFCSRILRLRQFGRLSEGEGKFARRQYDWNIKADCLRTGSKSFIIQEMHRNGIIHRDMKPANILISKGVFKIADLGFSKSIVSEESVGRHTCLGTRSTMAP